MAERSGKGPTRLTRIDDLRGCLVSAFERLGTEGEHAVGLADMLVDSELRGHPDHGAAMLGYLEGLYRDGQLNPRPNVRVERERDSVLLLEGDRGAGPVAPLRVARWCAERARVHGLAMGAVRHWQFINGSYFVERLVEAGCIGIVCANSTPLVAPPGSRTRTLGTNPLAFGIPAGRHPPVLLDMSTTNAAALRMRLAAIAGREVTTGLVLDTAGRDSTDPRDFLNGGSMAPLGYPLAPHKGFALAMLVDVLAGVLSGGDFALGTTGGSGTPGCFLLALDAAAFLGRGEVVERLDRQIDQIRAAEPAEDGQGTRLPGESGWLRRQRMLSAGAVPLSEASWRNLGESCERLGVSLPTPIRIES